MLATAGPVLSYSAGMYQAGRFKALQRQVAEFVVEKKTEMHAIQVNARYPVGMHAIRGVTPN